MKDQGYRQEYHEETDKGKIALAAPILVKKNFHSYWNTLHTINSTSTLMTIISTVTTTPNTTTSYIIVYTSRPLNWNLASKGKPLKTKALFI